MYTIFNPFLYLFILHSTIWYDYFPNKLTLYLGGYLLGICFLLFQAELARFLVTKQLSEIGLIGDKYSKT